MQMRLASILTALSAAAAVTAQSPLTTTFANNNGQDGNMFDIVATNAAGITVSYVDINCNTGTYDFEIYTKNSAYLPDVNNAAAWTLVGSVTGVVGQGAGVPTTLPICINQYVPAGATQAFYVTGTQNTFPINYTNGSATGALYTSNADLEFYEGSGLQYPFQANFNPRIWNGNIYYSVGQGTPCIAFAGSEEYGVGCGLTQYSSFYEIMTPANFDLNNTVVTGINTGAGYLVQAAPGAGFAPSAAATALALGDDVTQAVGTLGLECGSNGWLAAGAGNSAGFVPDAATFLANPSEGIYAWTDLQPNATGSGLFYYEEVGTQAILTADGVYGWGTTDQNFVQWIWETATGDFSIEFGATGLANPEDWLVGYSTAGASLDPGASDISSFSAVPLITAGSDSTALGLSSNRPILGGNWDLTTSSIDAISPIAITFFGDRGPAVPAALIGFAAPGCDINLATAIGSLSGANAGGSATVTIPVPNNPALTGQMLSGQSVCLSLQNAAGLLFSNGVEGTFGS